MSGQFIACNFVTPKTHHRLSAMVYDQIHEQINAIVKEDRGAIGLTKNNDALKRWIVDGPEMDQTPECIQVFQQNKRK